MAAKVMGLDGCAVPAIDAGRVAAARGRLIDAEEALRLTELFRLLSDHTRTRILFALLEVGELCVCDLAAAVGVPDTSVSHALRLLRTSKIVRARRAGRMMFYSLDDAHVRLLLDLTREHLRHGGPTSGVGTRPDRRRAANGVPRGPRPRSGRGRRHR